MKMLYEDRSEQDKEFIRKVCGDILYYINPYKEESNEFAGIFVEGRNREINCLEDFAAIHSFKAFSKYNYPIFCFVNNKENFLDNCSIYIKRNRINIIEIPPLNSLEEYTEFCIKKLYFMLPDWVENVITLQPDGMLLKNGWEDYIKNCNVDWLSSHWRHYAQIDWKIDNNWYIFTKKTAIGNGGFSFRKKSIMIELSKAFGSKLQDLREYGREDNRFPMEDLFFCGIMNTVFEKYFMPTLKQCCGFSRDPLDIEQYKDLLSGKDSFYGFHFFKEKSEWQKCFHP